MRNATDQGFPLKGEWRVAFAASKPRLESPVHCWRADQATAMNLEIAYTGKATTARVCWKRLDDELGIEPSQRLRDLERRMLQQDPALDEQPSKPATTSPSEPEASR